MTLKLSLDVLVRVGGGRTPCEKSHQIKMFLFGRQLMYIFAGKIYHTLHILLYLNFKRINYRSQKEKLQRKRRKRQLKS